MTPLDVAPTVKLKLKGTVCEAPTDMYRVTKRFCLAETSKVEPCRKRPDRPVVSPMYASGGQQVGPVKVRVKLAPPSGAVKFNTAFALPVETEVSGIW